MLGESCGTSSPFRSHRQSSSKFAVSLSTVSKVGRKYQENRTVSCSSLYGGTGGALQHDCQEQTPWGWHDWQVHHYCPILFVNESKFTMNTRNTRLKAGRCHCEHYTSRNIPQHDQLGSGSVVWGDVSQECRGPPLSWLRFSSYMNKECSTVQLFSTHLPISGITGAC